MLSTRSWFVLVSWTRYLSMFIMFLDISRTWASSWRHDGHVKTNGGSLSTMRQHAVWYDSWHQAHVSIERRWSFFPPILAGWNTASGLGCSGIGWCWGCTGCLVGGGWLGIDGRRRGSHVHCCRRRWDVVPMLGMSSGIALVDAVMDAGITWSAQLLFCECGPWFTFADWLSSTHHGPVPHICVAIFGANCPSAPFMGRYKRLAPPQSPK